MPVSVEFTDDLIGVVVRHQDIVSGKELYSAIASVYQDERFLTLKYWIADRTQCTQLDVDTSAIKKIALLNNKESLRNPGILLALVSPKDIEFGISRMFQSYAIEDKFIKSVFRDIGKAKQWIEKELNIKIA